jgi:Tfp pilus assembly protein FimT
MVEMSITVAILGILAAIAVPSFVNLMPRIRLGNATQTLANELAMARMAAISKSVDGEAAFDKDAEVYTLAKTVGGTPYARATLASSANLVSVTYLADGSTAPATVQLNANGTTSVPLQKQAMVITLATADGAHKRRVLVWATGRIHSQKWAGGSTWVAD